MDSKSTMKIALERIEKVMKSDWTGDLYITPSNAIDGLHSGIPGILFYGESKTDRLYNAIYRMVEGWPTTEDFEAGCLIYTRPTPPERLRNPVTPAGGGGA